MSLGIGSEGWGGWRLVGWWKEKMMIAGAVADLPGSFLPLVFCYLRPAHDGVALSLRPC